MPITGTLKRLCFRSQYKPALLGLFIHPLFLAHRGLWRAIAASREHPVGRLLDIGCGSPPYRELFPDRVYAGLAIDSEVARQQGVADALYGGGRSPFAEKPLA